MTVFSKMQYEAIAEIIKKLDSETAEDCIIDLVDEFIKAFERDNPNFDRTKFFKACGWIK